MKRIKMSRYIDTLEGIRMIPGLEEYLREQEERLDGIEEYTPVADAIMDNIAAIGIRFHIDPDFYMKEFVTNKARW